jgi:hypothetical protein
VFLPRLFSNADIFSLLNYRHEQLKDEVGGLDSTRIEQTPEQELVHDLAARYKLEMPVLDEDKASTEHREIDIDVSDDPVKSMIFGGGGYGPVHVKGTEITFFVPFRGDPNLLHVRPQQFSLNPPLGEVDAQEIKFTFRRTDNNAAEVKSEYDRNLASIKQHLTWLESSISDFNRKIGAQVQQLLNERKQKLAATASMMASVGIPPRRRTNLEEQRVPVASKSVTKSTASPKKWDVFISHASEDKTEVASPLAAALRNKGVAVWYDEFSLKLGDSLRSSIDYGLANTRYGVVILSKHFFQKNWPVQELNGLSTREVAGNKVILPVWHNVSADEVRGFSPILADRLAAKSDIGIEALVEQIINVLEEE